LAASLAFVKSKIRLGLVDSYMLKIFMYAGLFPSVILMLYLVLYATHLYTLGDPTGAAVFI
jgi:hypothetical protein